MKQHSDEVRAAVMAALLTGQGVREVARQFALDPSLVSRWKRQLTPEQVAAATAAQGARGEGQQADFGELLAAYVRRSLISLTRQVEQFGDPEWIKKQSAADLAVLHGVQTDKAIRLLEAFECAGERDAGDPGHR